MKIFNTKGISIQTKSSIVYTISNLFTKGMSVISIPIFTRLLTTNEMGVSTTYSSWYAILYTIVTLSLCSGSVNVAMMDYEGRRDEYESSCLTLSSISAILFIILFIIFQNFFNKITTLNNSMMILMSISFLFNPALDFWYARQRYEYKYRSSFFISVLSSLLSTFASVAIVYFSSIHNIGHDLGEVRVLSQNMIFMLFSSIFYFYILSKGRHFIDFSIWRYAIKLSFPLIIHSMAKSILDMSDRIMISYICGNSFAGIYGTLYSFSSMSLLVWNAINTSLIPSIFAYIKNNQTHAINRLLKRVLTIFALVTILATLLAPEAIKLLTTNDYYEGIKLMPALFAGVYFTALYNIYSNLLLYKKKTLNIMVSTLMAAILNVFLNSIFINLMGYIAAAYTTLISFILLALFQGLMVRFVFKGKVVDDTSLIIISIICVLLCLFSNILYDVVLLRYIIIASILMIGFIKRHELLT